MMNKLLTIILFLLSVTCVGQDSTSITVVTRNQKTGAPIPNLKIQFSYEDSIFLNSSTDHNGEIELKYASQKFPCDAEIKIALNKEVKDYHFNHGSIRWKPNYNFYQEIYFIEKKEGFRTLLAFLFKENSSNPIEDSLEMTYNMYIEILDLHPEIVLSINAFNNFYENNDIQEQRAEKIKKGFIERGVDPERLVINVEKESDYKMFYNGIDSEGVPMDESFAENASKEELDYMKFQYQSVWISIDSWDYDPDQ